jgi:hypothetical protein
MQDASNMACGWLFVLHRASEPLTWQIVQSTSYFFYIVEAFAVKGKL